MDEIGQWLTQLLLGMVKTSDDLPFVEVRDAQECEVRQFRDGISARLTENSMWLLFSYSVADPFSECVKIELCKEFSKQSHLLRNVPVDGSDLTFLLTPEQVLCYGPDRIVSDVYKIIEAIKHSVAPLSQEIGMLTDSFARNLI